LSHPHPELTLPPQLAKGAVRIVALGGLGEVGRNMAVLEYAGRLLVIDCGVLFPEDHHPGVDLILPDFEYIADRLDDIDAIVLTHGHEDHIGAVPYLLRLRADIPLIGSTLTLAMIEAKLKEHRIKPFTLTVTEGQREMLGVFDCEFVAVNHSIPDALAVFVRTPGGTILHTGDFKLDQLPLDGRITDLRAFARFGEEGVDLFLTDSTNAEVPGFTTGSATPAAGSSSPASPPTSTESSRSWMPPTPTAARSPWSVARCCATWASPRSSAISRCRRTWLSISRSSATTRTTRSC
jgi:ribonuclease J